MKKNIILVIHDLKGNGAERVILTLADAFLRQGHRCNIVCFKDLQELPSEKNIVPYIFPMKIFRWIPRKIRGRLIAPLFDVMIRRKFGTPDLVLSNLLPVDRILAHSQLNHVFIVIHNTFSKEFSSAMGKMTMSPKTRKMLQDIYCRKPLVCVSEGVRDDLPHVFDCPIQAQTIYNPVDADFIRQQARQTTPKQHALPSEYLLHVGKFNTAKRQDFLIKAYAKSKVSTPLVLLGQGPLKMHCEQLVKQLGIEKNVIFLGFASNPYPIISRAKALLVSSDYEGLGMVILEAIVLGVAVISTDCDSGPREILPPENLIPVGHLEQFSQAIQDVDKQPQTYRCDLKSGFSQREALQQYLSLIE